MMCGLHPEEAARPPEIDEIDSYAETGRESAAHVEERYRIQRLVGEHPHVDVAVAAGFSPRMASVEPRAEKSAIRKGGSEFLTQGIGESISSEHARYHTRSLAQPASARARSLPVCRR